MAIEVKIFHNSMDNTYVVRDTLGGDAFVVDPGEYNSELKGLIESMGIEKLRYILLTHGHFDHIMGVKELKAEFGGDIVIHHLDADCLYSQKHLGGFFGHFPEEIHEDISVKEGDSLPFGDDEIKVIHTPGHTVGSVCFKVENYLFTGDTLFYLTVGRTDFPEGSMEDMLRSMKTLYRLEGDYRVCPGHDRTTTLEFERNNNPYMRNIK